MIEYLVDFLNLFEFKLRDVIKRLERYHGITVMSIVDTRSKISLTYIRSAVRPITITFENCIANEVSRIDLETFITNPRMRFQENSHMI